MNRSPEREEFLSDIITTAIEGGTGYWAVVSQYQWRDDDGAVQPCVGKIREGEGTRATIEDEDDGKVYDVTTEDIARALGMLRNGQPIRHLRDEQRRFIVQADRENEAGDIDADDADIIMQLATLGEIVYG